MGRIAYIYIYIILKKGLGKVPSGNIAPLRGVTYPWLLLQGGYPPRGVIFHHTLKKGRIVDLVGKKIALFFFIINQYNYLGKLHRY